MIDSCKLYVFKWWIANKSSHVIVWNKIGFLHFLSLNFRSLSLALIGYPLPRLLLYLSLYLFLYLSSLPQIYLLSLSLSISHLTLPDPSSLYLISPLYIFLFLFSPSIFLYFLIHTHISGFSNFLTFKITLLSINFTIIINNLISFTNSRFL